MQSVGAGDHVTFAMTVTNNGPGDADDTVLNAAFQPSAGVKAILPAGDVRMRSSGRCIPAKR